MRLVVALGGNALLRRGEPMTSQNQRANVRAACDQLAKVAIGNELLISHGNGPQVGLLALQNAAYEEIETYPLDVLDAETQGMIGYIVGQELGNRLPFDHPIATLLTMIEVDPDDPAFDSPTKPIGPTYVEAVAKDLQADRGWTFVEVDGGLRRVVPSPKPKQIFELRQIEWLLEQGCTVICAGGGGIPTMYEGGQLVGVEAVIDKDHASRLLAVGVRADTFVMATDADGIYTNWGTDDQRQIARIHPDTLADMAKDFPIGSMRPKARAGCDFVLSTGKPALIGALADIEAMLDGDAGTFVSVEIDSVVYRDQLEP